MTGFDGPSQEEVIVAVVKLSKGNVPSSQQILALAQGMYPDLQVTSKMGGRFVAVKKSGLIGANIVPRNKDIVVRADFGSTGTRVLFMILIFASVLIFAIIYFAAFFPQQAKFADQVAADLKKELESGGAAETA
ncbi:MAG: hypothetical protein IT385_24105 [Deltaproteobacteria bacterium]|nr:hypothetical protein [Deltaproteobacteria bacterium]